MEDASAALIDWAKFARMRTQLGGDFIRILGYFREDGTKSVAAIEEAMRARDARGLVMPAHTLKGESRQFGAEPLAAAAEKIEQTARFCIETHRFPDELVPDVVELRRLWNRTVEHFEKATNPLQTRAAPMAGGFGKKAANQGFGRI